MENNDALKALMNNPIISNLKIGKSMITTRVIFAEGLKQFLRPKRGCERPVSLAMLSNGNIE